MKLLENESSPLLRTVRERRTIREYSDREVPRGLVLQLLNDACWTPYHSKTAPWRFIVLDQAAKEAKPELNDSYIECFRSKVRSEEELQQLAVKIRSFKQRIPVEIAVVMRKQVDELAHLEALTACAAFIQTFQLLAWEHEIGVCWRSNVLTERMRPYCDSLGMARDEIAAGVMTLGYFKPESVPQPKPRERAEQLTTFL